MRSLAVGIVGLLLVGGMALAQDVAPLGGQFQVNTYTTSLQYRAAVASDAGGDFIVVWDSVGSSGTDTSDRSSQAQRFQANGLALGGEFQINTYTTNRQWKSDLAVGPLGDFVVVWESTYSDGPDTDPHSIQAQRFEGDGTPEGGQFEVNSHTTNDQKIPSVGSDADGNFVVLWQSLGPDASWWSVQAQLYDDSGTPSGGEFQVNSYTTSYQTLPAVAFDEQGDFVVVWQSRGSYGTDNNHWSIQAQRFEGDGTLDGGEFQVNSYITSHQYHPAVAVGLQGDFVVVWGSNGSSGTDTDYWSIQAQRFDASGTPAGDQFQVNSYTTGGQEEPIVALDALGNFIVVWESSGSYGTDSSDQSIQAQLFDASGSPVGGQFQVNSYTTNKQQSPVASSLDPEGNFVVVWGSQGSAGTDPNDWSVQAQRFASRAVLVDSFESGDLSAWSSIVQ